MSRREDLRDREYRAAYADSFLDTLIATQIKVLREQRGYTQAKLAELAGMKQSRISAMEDVNYSSWNTTTLKRLAKAFDLPLFTFFGTFDELLEYTERLSREFLERPAFVQDPSFSEVAGADTATGSVNIRHATLDVPIRMIKASLPSRRRTSTSTATSVALSK